MKTIIQFKSIDSFYTRRLAAFKVTADDLKKFVTMHSDTNVMATLGGLRTIKQTQKNVDWNLRQWRENGFGLWMFYLKDTNEWVGRGGLRRVEVGGHEEIELGYALMPQFWNQGLATEISKASIEIAFEVMHLDNIVSFTLTTNKASQRVMEKVGFQYERDIIHAELPHVLYRIKNPRKVEILPYDKKWPELFKQEARQIQCALGNHLSAIYHMGSTAIPNMPAKPIIDILLVCENVDTIDDITQKLNSLNYYNIRRHVIPHRSFFTRKQHEHISYHLHIRERGDTQINRHINFRDYVIAHPSDAKQYAELKIKLADQFSEDINSYVLGKDKLVQEIDTKATLWSGRKRDYLPPHTGAYAREWTQEKLIKAMVANLNVQMTHFAQYLNQVELIRIPGFTIVNSGLRNNTFNYVLDADFSSAEANKKINEVTDYCRKKNIPFSWWISPYDKPDDLSKYLENNGYINTENSVAMYFDLDKWNGRIDIPSDLRIVQAKNKKTLRDFAIVLTNNEASCIEYFEWVASVLTEDDPLEYFVGYVNDKPVVCGSSCYFAQLTGLNDLSTAPAERHKGYAKAMQYYQLKRAKDLGYHIATLQAAQDSYPLYAKLGYKECGIFRAFKLTEKNWLI